MSSNELIITLYQIGDSFNNEPIWPFIERMIGLILLGCCVVTYVYLTIRESYTIRLINKIRTITNGNPN
jgi:hypothetical protein